MHSVDTLCLFNRLVFSLTGRASAWRVQAAPAAAVAPDDNVADAHERDLAPTMCSAMRLPTWSAMRLFALFFFLYALWFLACFRRCYSFKTVSMRLPVIGVWVCTSGILQPTFLQR